MHLWKASCFTALIFVFSLSCESREQKPSEAFDLVKKTKLEKSDSALSVPILPEAAINTKPPGDWEIFTTTMNAIIQKNERKVKEAKGIPNQNGKTLGEIIRFEKANNELRGRMNEYHEAEKLRLEKFKSEMLKEGENLRISLDNTILKKE